MLRREHAAEFGYTVTGNAGVATRDPADLTNELKILADGGAEAVMMALYHAQRAGFICELKNARFEALSGWIEP